MIKPIIGITLSQVNLKNRLYNQNPSAYSEAVVLAGGLPLLIPNETAFDEIPFLFKHLDGLLLSGGGDIDIRLYNGKPHSTILEVSKARDQLEISLLKHALQFFKPVFGICRGIQLINVALGGTLYTDIADQYKTEINHSTPDDKGRDYLAHDVILESGSKLEKIIGAKRLTVNSFHHQAIHTPAPDLVVTAHASDGLIEAVEYAGEAVNLMGVQWHPECMLESPAQLELFKAFITAC